MGSVCSRPSRADAGGHKRITYVAAIAAAAGLMTAGPVTAAPIVAVVDPSTVTATAATQQAEADASSLGEVGFNVTLASGQGCGEFLVYIQVPGDIDFADYRTAIDGVLTDVVSTDYSRTSQRQDDGSLTETTYAVFGFDCPASWLDGSTHHVTVQHQDGRSSEGQFSGTAPTTPRVPSTPLTLEAGRLNELSLEGAWSDGVNVSVYVSQCSTGGGSGSCGPLDAEFDLERNLLLVDVPAGYETHLAKFRLLGTGDDWSFPGTVVFEAGIVAPAASEEPSDEEPPTVVPGAWVRAEAELVGTTRVGEVLRVKRPRIKAAYADQVTVGYRWKVGGQLLKKQRGPKLALRPWMRGKPVVGVVIYRSEEYTPLRQLVRAGRVRR